MEENKVIEENTGTARSVKKKAMPEVSENKIPVNTENTEDNENSNLDLLALDSDSDEDSHESAEESADYASFLASYNALMAERLAKARAASAESEAEAAPSESEDDQTESDVSVEDADASADTPEDIEEEEEVEIIVKQDIEFHKEIVSKSERGNAEDHIVLVRREESADEEPEELEDEQEADESEEITEESAEAQGFIFEEYENEPKIVAESIDYDPHQISMLIKDESKDEPADPSRYNERKPRIVDYAYDVIEMIVLTLMAAIVITSIFFRFSFVDGHSMDRTLSDGDTLVISNLFYTPDYGDIVVLEYENNIHEVKPLIKRVIGLPGDTIRVTADGDVYRNGELLNEDSYVYLDGPLYSTLKGEWKVKDGEIFVMGDHRNDSMDSREIGPVKIDSIIGRAVFRLFPLKDIGTIK